MFIFLLMNQFLLIKIDLSDTKQHINLLSGINPHDNT